MYLPVSNALLFLMNYFNNENDKTRKKINTRLLCTLA